MQAVLRTLRKVTLVFLALVGATFIVLRLAAPMPIDGHEATLALAAAAIDLLRQRTSPAEITYVSFNGQDPLEASLGIVRTALPAFALRRMGERSAAQNSCEVSSVNAIQVSPCETDNYLELRFSSMPLWRVAIVHAKTAACGVEVTLIRTTEWKVVSTRGLCA